VDAFATRCALLAAAHGKGFALTPEVIETLRKHQPVYGSATCPIPGEDLSVRWRAIYCQKAAVASVKWS